MRNTFVNTLFLEAQRNPNLVVITGDLGYQLFDDFSSFLPKQFINAGLTEQSMMSMAAGIASTGKRVFVYSIANFSTLRCLEQIRNDVCYMDRSVVVVSVGAGYSYGTLGYSHHAVEDIAIMRSLPNLQVVCPSDSVEVEQIVPLLVNGQSPVYLRLGKAGEKILHSQTPKIEWGRFIELQSGKDGYIFYTGAIGSVAQEATLQLARSGIHIALVSVPFLSSLDMDYLEKVSKDSKIVVLEEHGERGGMTSAFLEAFNRLGKSVIIHSIASKQSKLSLTGTQDFLRLENGLTSEAIMKVFE
jgi:transketolase